MTQDITIVGRYHHTDLKLFMKPEIVHIAFRFYFIASFALKFEAEILIKCATNFTLNFDFTAQVLHNVS